MKRHRLLGVLLSLVALTVWAPAPAEAQTAADTVTVQIQGILGNVVIDSVAVRTLWHVGDTIHFVAVARDSQGDTVSALFTWASSDSTVLKFTDPQRGTAVAMKPSKGVKVYVLAQQVDTAIIGFLDSNDSLRVLSSTDQRTKVETDYAIWRPAPGDSAQFCMYALFGGQLVAQNQECPQSYGLPAPSTAIATIGFPGYEWLRSDILAMAAVRASGR